MWAKQEIVPIVDLLLAYVFCFVDNGCMFQHISIIHAACDVDTTSEFHGYDDFHLLSVLYTTTIEVQYNSHIMKIFMNVFVIPHIDSKLNLNYMSVCYVDVC